MTPSGRATAPRTSAVTRRLGDAAKGLLEFLVSWGRMKERGGPGFAGAYHSQDSFPDGGVRRSLLVERLGSFWLACAII